MTEQATPGPWHVTRSRQGGLAVNNHKEFVSDFPIAEIFGPWADAKANAELIAEAGTVKTECGLSPRQLMHHRSQLLIALMQAKSVLSTINSSKFHKVSVDGAECYWQTDEWIKWARDEVFPVVLETLEKVGGKNVG